MIDKQSAVIKRLATRAPIVDDDEKINEDLLPSGGPGRDELLRLYSQSFDEAFSQDPIKAFEMPDLDGCWTLDGRQLVFQETMPGINPLIIKALLFDDTKPLYRWFHARWLIIQYLLFNEGDRSAVEGALCLCLQCGFPMPRWWTNNYQTAGLNGTFRLKEQVTDSRNLIAEAQKAYDEIKKQQKLRRENQR